MARIIAATLLICTLCSCSFLQRHNEDEDTEIESSSANSKSSARSSALEGEVAKLSSRLEALETRIDVITSTMEKNRLRENQPVISAAPPSAPSLAHEVPEEAVQAAHTPSPAIPTKDQTDAENRFREGMELFQAGKNAEASSKFTGIAQQYPTHTLSAHALYWAGEASARSQRWSTAIEQWETLERDYSRSAYLPEALAGLSRAYDSLGDRSKARAYKDTLLQAFPQAPVTLNFTTHSESENNSQALEDESSDAPSTATQVDE